MKKQMNRVTFVFLVLVIICGIFLVGKNIVAIAQEKNFYDSIIENQPQLVNDIAATQADPQIVKTPEEKTTNYAEKLSNTVSQWEEEVFSEPGWIHFVYRLTSNVENGVVLPDGNVMSKDYINDGWFLINSDGLVEKHIITLINDSGKILQQEIFDHGVMINLITNDKIEDVKPYKLKLDLGVSEQMLGMKNAGSILNYQSIGDSSQTIAEYSILGTYEKPINIGNIPQPVASVETIALFNVKTSAMTETRTIMHLIDGSELVHEKDEILTLQSASLPEEIAKLLEVSK